MGGERLQVTRNLPAAWIRGKKSREVGLMRAHQFRKFGNAISLRLAYEISDQRRGNVHAVEDIADVVQHARGNFGHPGLARSFQKLPMHPGEFEFGLLAFGHVAESPNSPVVRTVFS